MNPLFDEIFRLYYIGRRDLEKIVDENRGDPSHDPVPDGIPGLHARFSVKVWLQCHDFSWYMQNVATEKFVLDEVC